MDIAFNELDDIWLPIFRFDPLVKPFFKFIQKQKPMLGGFSMDQRSIGSLERGFFKSVAS